MKIKSYKKNHQTFYKFRISLPADPVTGKRQKIQRSGFTSRLEAEKAYIEIKETKPKAKNQKLETFDEVFNALIDLKKLESKESTIRRQMATYNNHFKEQLGSIPISQITSDQLQQILINLHTTFKRPLKPFGLIEQVFRLAYKKRIIDENPCDFIAKPKIKHNAESNNFYTKEELKEFLKCAERDLSHMWYVFFHLLAYTGMRRGEALALKWTDYDGQGLTISRNISMSFDGHVVSESPKTDASRRHILLDSVTIKLIDSLDRDSEFIFHNSKGSFITPSQPIRQLHKIKDIKYVTPHGLRHTHCSLLFSAGVSIPEVQQRLGHKDIRTTLGIYNHIYKEDQEAALNKFIEFMD